MPPILFIVGWKHTSRNVAMLQPSGKVWPGDIQETGPAVQLSPWCHRQHPRMPVTLNSLSTPLAW